MIDKSKSVLDRLKGKSKTTGIAYQQLIQLLCQEEFLRRLSGSDYVNHFVLKGGLFIYILSEFKSRTTVDMDFLLRNQSNNKEEIIISITNIINVKTENKFIEFEIVKVEHITVDKKYPGVSVHMIGKIGKTKTPVNIDIGIGDVIIPKSEMRLMRAQLTDFEDVNVNTYSLESVIAEKFDAILQRFELTSRMKDFYDIWYISRNFDFDGLNLSKAIKETLANRGTIIQKDSIERIKRLEVNQIVLNRWTIFNKKMKINLELKDCIHMIDSLLNPIVDSLLNDELVNGIWVSSDLEWKD